MSAIARRLSVAELSQQVLEMGKSGVYRESVFEALHPMATKSQIRQAIAYAKKFGLHSVANLRDPQLGTYYQLDLVTYQALQHLVESSLPLAEDGKALQRLTEVTATVQRMLVLGQALAVGMVVLGIACSLMGQPQAGFGLFSGALSVGVVWAMQRAIAHTTQSIN